MLGSSSRRCTARGSGHLVFVSSLSGKAATARASLYCATKFGLRGFALALREDLRGTGVGVSVVMPGMIRDAGMFADANAAAPALTGTSSPAEVGAGSCGRSSATGPRSRSRRCGPAALSAIGANAPELAGRVAGSTATKVADKIAAGQSR